MAELNIGHFDANEHEPLQDFTPIPPGEYLAYITESDVMDTKAGTGKYLSLVWVIAEGEYEGRKVFDNVNLANPNPKAVEIGRRQLADICRACEKLSVADSAELHELPVKIKVVIKPAEGQYQARNEIKGYANPATTKAAATAAVGASAAKTTPNGTAKPAAAAAPAGAKKLPWQK